MDELTWLPDVNITRSVAAIHRVECPACNWSEEVEDRGIVVLALAAKELAREHRIKCKPLAALLIAHLDAEGFALGDARLKGTQIPRVLS